MQAEIISRNGEFLVIAKNMITGETWQLKNFASSDDATRFLRSLTIDSILEMIK